MQRRKGKLFGKQENGNLPATRANGFSLIPCFSWVKGPMLHIGTAARKPLKRLSELLALLNTQLKQGVNDIQVFILISVRLWVLASLR
jgi:hypothetical protein